MKISDLMDGVKAKLGDRTDQTGRMPVWIKDAVLELTESYPFEELRVTGPSVAFQTGIAEYDITYFTNNNEVPTIINSWWVSTTTTVGTTGRVLKYRTLPVVEYMSKTTGQVSKWTKNGRRFIVGNAPSQAYATFMRYQRTHPFMNTLAPTPDDTIYMPDSWSIIIEFHAAMIGAYELRMLDYASNYHSCLYGDPDFKKTGRGNPGLIFSKTSQYDRDSSNNERAMQVVVLKSCAS